jgi:hypothetical protein
MCNDALFSLVIMQRKNSIKRASRLERAYSLEVFALKKQFRARALIQNSARQYRCSMDVRQNALVCSFDVGKGEGGSIHRTCGVFC